MNNGLTLDSAGPTAPGHVPPRLRIDQVVALSHFPVYGLLGHPEGLTLQSIGYCGDQDLQGTPSRLTQVSLAFAYPPSSHRRQHLLEVITTDPALAPNLTLPSTNNTGSSLAITRFQLADRAVLLLLHPEQRKQPTWSFIISADHLRVDGRAIGWTQAALLELLQHVGAVHGESHDMAGYAVEQEAWTRYLSQGLHGPR